MESNTKLDTMPIVGKIRERNMSQQEFADKDGRSLTAVRKILNGESEMSWGTIVRWSEILGVEIGSAEFMRLFFSTKS